MARRLRIQYPGAIYHRSDRAQELWIVPIAGVPREVQRFASSYHAHRHASKAAARPVIPGSLAFSLRTGLGLIRTLIRGDLNHRGMTGRKNCEMVASALALLMLIQAAGPTSALSTASAGQRGKSKPRMGGYGPVVKEELYGEYTCLATGGKRAQFQLTFTADHFEMKGAGGPIPREVLETVLGAGNKAEKIEGHWDLAAGKLFLTEIRADGRPGFNDMVLRPFRTGPNSRWFTRFDVGGTQYHLRPN